MRTPTLLLLTFAAGLFAQPTITPGGIVNASGYQTTLAPGVVFVIFGTGLGPSTIATAPAPNYPSTLGGTSIAFTSNSGGAPIQAGMVYTVASQVAGFLPSSVAPGTYNVTVSYNGTPSASQSVTVVARSLGIAASNSAGTGPAQATIGNVNGGISLVRLTAGSVAFGGYTWTLGPAHPGDTLVLWGTGGGADAANDTGGTSGDQTAAGKFSISVDGTSITPLYAGTSSGYPGLWQINFTLPATIAADCFASLQVTAGGNGSNYVTIAIAAPGQTSCTSSIPPATLSKLDSGTGNVTMAGLVIGSIVGPTTEAYVGGVINQYTVGEFLLPFTGPKIGMCRVLQETYAAGAKEPSAADLQLDGGVLTLSSGGSRQTVTELSFPTGPTYNSNVTPTPGATYTLSGAGGTGVGPFSVQTTFPASFVVTNFSSLTTVTRTQPLTISWTSSGVNTVLIIISTDTITTTQTTEVTVSCAVPASLGTYTIPAAALAFLLSSPSGAQLQVEGTVAGSAPISAESTMAPNTVIPLAAGGLVDFGGFGPFIDYLTTISVH